MKKRQTGKCVQLACGMLCGGELIPYDELDFYERDFDCEAGC